MPVGLVASSTRFASSSLSSEDVRALFTRAIMCWEKGNAQAFWELLDISSELTLIYEDLKCHCGSPVKVGIHSCQEVEEVLTLTQLTVSPANSGPHAVAICLVLQSVRPGGFLRGISDPRGEGLPVGRAK